MTPENRRLQLCALLSLHSLTGELLASETEYEELTTIHSFWWAVEQKEGRVSECVRQGWMRRGGGKGQGERRRELHKTAFVCPRARERLRWKLTLHVRGSFSQLNTRGA